MAQEFVALQCCQCRTYQVQQSRKATKWLCRVCNHKQSVKQFYGRGSAMTCRLTVQSLNRQLFGQQDMTLWQSSEGEGPDATAGAGDSHDTRSSDSDPFGVMEESNDSSDDSLKPKRKKLAQNEENIEIDSQMIFCNTSNGLDNKQRVSKWTKFLKR